MSQRWKHFSSHPGFWLNIAKYALLARTTLACSDFRISGIFKNPWRFGLLRHTICCIYEDFYFFAFFPKNFFGRKWHAWHACQTYVILKSFSTSCGIAAFYAWKKITIFFICFSTKSFDNSWENEPPRNIIRRKLASVARFEVYEEPSQNLIFWSLNLKFMKNRLKIVV